MACPHCGETILSTAELCPLCQQTALVSLSPEQPVTEPRLRYQLGRRLVESGASAPLGELLKRLERGEAVARGLTAATASRLESTFQSLGVAARRKATPHRRSESLPSEAKAASAGSSAALSIDGRARRGLLMAVGLAVLLLAGLAGALLRGAARDPAPQPQAVASLVAAALQPQAIARQTLPSIVLLRCGGHLGTGFFVTENKLVSNAHVTCGDEPIQVEMKDGRKGEARVERADEMLDAAVLTLSDLTGKPLTLASAGALSTGDVVMVAGHPRGLDFTFHVGAVSNANRMLLGINYVQVDARINPGNSGGPMLDASGHVVGIVSLKRPGAEGLGMALPIDYLYEGSEPLLLPPPGHPTPGFRAMLDTASEAKRKLIAEQSELHERLVDVRPASNGRLIATVTAMSSLSPREILPFRLENAAGDRCGVDASATWRKSAPGEGFEKRIDEFLKREGLGDVYFAFVELSFERCNVPNPTKLILAIGNEAENTIQLD